MSKTKHISFELDTKEIKVRKPFAPKGKAFKSAKDYWRKPKHKRDYTQEVEDARTE